MPRMEVDIPTHVKTMLVCYAVRHRLTRDEALAHLIQVGIHADERARKARAGQ